MKQVILMKVSPKILTAVETVKGTGTAAKPKAAPVVAAQPAPVSNGRKKVTNSIQEVDLTNALAPEKPVLGKSKPKPSTENDASKR